MATPSEIKARETHATDADAPPSKLPDQDRCCGGPAPKGAEACCALDAELKSASGSGCGCASKPAAGTTATKRCC
jgi:hypothetical protein